MNSKISAFLPCRRGSERIPDKNIIPFAQYSNGLIELKLLQLIACKEISQIIISTNDSRIIKIAERISLEKKYENIILDIRPEHLSSSKTSTDEVISYVKDNFLFDHLLWTHVTSPFVTSDDYTKAINLYFSNLSSGYDSLMTGHYIQSFLWDENGPINYEKNVEKWPRTQTLKKIFDVDSAIFIASHKVYKELDDRVGRNPLLLDLEKDWNIDIDWPHQFRIAASIWKNISHEKA